MSQNDLTIANQGFASFRSDLNSALQALGSTNSGTSAPSTTFANQLFYDTTNNILKIRNEDNDAFISLFTLDQSNDNIESLTVDGILTVATSVKTPLIEFTDGDDALTITDGGNVAVGGTLTANGGVTVDNITIDGTEIDSSGDLTLDVAGDIVLDADGADIKLKDGGTQFGQLYKSGNDFRIESNVQDGDLVFTGNDGGSGVTALTLDMSDGGSATFAKGITLTTGNLALASGGGIDFSANSNQSGMSSELFDHYEEGTFSPIPFSNVTQIGTSSATGFYTKIGNRVFVNGSLTRNDSASLTSTFQLRNLPFTSSSSSGNQNIMGGFWFDTASSTDQVGFAYMASGENRLYAKTLGLSAAYISADAFEHGRPLYFGAMYFV